MGIGFLKQDWGFWGVLTREAEGVGQNPYFSCKKREKLGPGDDSIIS